MSDLPPPPRPPEPEPGAGQQPQQPQQPQPGYGAPPGQGQGYGPPPGYGAPQGYGPPPGNYGYGPQVGIVPQNLNEVFYQPWLNVLLFAITCGIWGGVWSWRTHDDLQKYNGDGLGGIVGLILGLLVGVVIMFTVPMEIEKMYQRDGRQSPVSTIWGLWFLLPIVGQFIWYFKVQAALNDFWESKGARRL